MTLLRRLTALASRPGALDAIGRPHSGAIDGSMSSRGRSDVMSLHGAVGAMQADATGTAAAGAGYGASLSGLMAVNLIRAHRDELMQASSGKP